MVGARVIVPAALTHLFDDVGRRLIDRCDDRTGKGIRFLAYVDCIGRKTHSLASEDCLRYAGNIGGVNHAESTTYDTSDSGNSAKRRESAGNIQHPFCARLSGTSWP